MIRRLLNWLDGLLPQTCDHGDVNPGTFICNECGENVEHTFTDPEDV